MDKCESTTMCSNSELPKQFKKTTEILPFTRHGILTVENFKKAEENVQNLERLKKLGLSSEEIRLYEDNEAGLLNNYQKIECSILKSKLDAIYDKINKHSNRGSTKQCDEQPSTSNSVQGKIQKNLQSFFPQGHPMNELKKIENDLFDHLNNDNIIPITKRRKMLRRLERKRDRIMFQNQRFAFIPTNVNSKTKSPSSLWDMKEMPEKITTQQQVSKERVMGPKNLTMYTIKDDKIVRLNPLHEDQMGNPVEYQAVDIVLPINSAEKQLLEGTKMSIDDIKNIERFKDYEPGAPSKVLYLKNIAMSVSQDQLSLLFNQFILDNGGPVDLKLMTGRMRGQAFATFRNEETAIRALEEINGTILGGKPIIAQFGRNENR